MANNRIKHKLLKMERKFQSQKSKLEKDEKQREVDELKEFYENKKTKYLELIKLKERLYLAKKRSNQLIKEFKEKKISEYQNHDEFEIAYKDYKDQCYDAVKKLNDEYIDAKLAYAYEFETSSFKIKRWFYGIQKEVNRISWMKKKNMFYAFIVVVSITLSLSILFLIINLIFIKGI